MASTATTPSPQSAQEQIDICTAHANPTWRQAALAALTHLASRRSRLISFDVLEELEKSGVTTHDLRAIGGVMQEGRDLGLISSVGLVRRNDKHTRGATTLWASNLRQPVRATSGASEV